MFPKSTIFPKSFVRLTSIKSVHELIKYNPKK